ncbi:MULTISPECIES: hypothetical protein [unclassified Streptomyces]|uniref:hypothetical protein n=1 Tax=unclassified Streptomyces TaxID=2593676 RepID=UPI000C275A3B|nr:hypothetical protein [Streptomyces sp. CB02959]PJN36839.1 hypothetical protein CG747_31815 [Streptomyces sp. CB02959]
MFRATNTAAPGGNGPGPASQAVPPGSDFDFRVPGVRIFTDYTNPGSPVAGLGYPGQGFGTDDGPEDGPQYNCDNGTSTTTWTHGTNRTTQVSGWVPLCNLVRL